jgi:hypothetical protein
LVDIILNLPEDLAERARAAGLLTDEQIARLLEIELEREARIEELASDMRKLHSLQPPLTQKEIDEELRAYPSLRQ